MIKNNRSAFTLAEMMIVMLILTILLAAFAPLMTRKAKVDLSSPWRWASNNSDIYYGMGNNQTAMIGQNNKAATDPNVPLLIARQTGSVSPFIALSSNGNILQFGANRDSIVINSNYDLPADHSSGYNTVIGAGSYRGSGGIRTYLDNTIIGTRSMIEAWGERNTAVGASALTGEQAEYLYANTAVGSAALFKITKGERNTAIGANSLIALTEGKNNTALGWKAGSGITTGSNNIAIGEDSCKNVTTGNNKVCIGKDSGPTSDASLNSLKEIYLGDSSTTTYISGAVNITGTFSAPQQSDRRLKKNITENNIGLEKIKQIKVFNYTFKKDEKKTPRVGVIAQDLLKVFPDAVTTGEDGYLRIRTEDMFYASINAIKQLDKMLQDLVAQVKTVVAQVAEHDTQIKALQKENKELKNKVQTLEEQNKSFEARLKAIEKKL